mgnify:CR=1 FL=1
MRGLIRSDTASRDLFDAKLMGILTPRPPGVRRAFHKRYANDPKEATDWF